MNPWANLTADSFSSNLHSPFLSKVQSVFFCFFFSYGISPMKGIAGGDLDGFLNGSFQETLQNGPFPIAFLN